MRVYFLVIHAKDPLEERFRDRIVIVFSARLIEPPEIEDIGHVILLQQRRGVHTLQRAIKIAERLACERKLIVRRREILLLRDRLLDRKSTRLNSSHSQIS